MLRESNIENKLEVFKELGLFITKDEFEKNYTEINSQYDIFKLYYNNFYNKHYESINSVSKIIDNKLKGLV